MRKKYSYNYVCGAPTTGKQKLKSKTQESRLMQNEDSSIQTLVKLGLTIPQAKIYLAIVSVQKANATEISALSKVARPDVYRILPAIEEKGLVKKIITLPTTFEAIPLKQACDMLLDRKKEELAEIRQDTASLIDNFYEEKHYLRSVSAGNFQMVSSMKLLLEMLAFENSVANQSIDLIGKWPNVRPVVFGCHQFFPKALKRGVKIRVITDSKPNDYKIKILRNPLFELRFLGESVPIKACIYDRKKANMCVGVAYNDVVPSLWSDNPEFLKMMNAYFDNIWGNAKVIPELIA